MGVLRSYAEWSWLRRLSWWLYCRECEWAQSGIYLVLGFKPGDPMPWYSPSRITLALDNHRWWQTYIGVFRRGMESDVKSKDDSTTGAL